jgi:hypothetical protein
MEHFSPFVITYILRLHLLDFTAHSVKLVPTSHTHSSLSKGFLGLESNCKICFGILSSLILCRRFIQLSHIILYYLHFRTFPNIQAFIPHVALFNLQYLISGGKR